MKTTTPLSLILLSTLGLSPAIAKPPQEKHGDPYRPVGTLHISRLMVQTGVRPLLSWNIEYPQGVSDILEISPEGGLTTKVPTLVEIRVVGMGNNGHSNNGHGNNLDGVDVSNPGQGDGGPNGEDDPSGSYDDEAKMANFKMLTGGGTWIELFSGDSTQVVSDEVLHSWIAQPGEVIDFMARIGPESDDGNTVQWSQLHGLSVVGLTNGDPFPNIYEGAKIGSFLSSYVDKDEAIVLGPREMIFLFELDSSDPANELHDMQDIVVVVSFKDVPQT